MEEKRLNQAKLKNIEYKYFKEDTGTFKRGGYVIAELTYLNDDNIIVTKTSALNYISLLNAFARNELQYLEYIKGRG